MAAFPTLRQMQFFTALVRRRSFSRAADDCFVSQSTLSAGVKEFETILGAPLVDRSARSFALTSLGEEVASRAQEILALTGELVRIAEARPPLTGELRLALIPTIGPFLLPRLMPLLDETYPDLRLFLREELTDTLVAGLRSGRHDMAVLALPIEDEGLDTLIFAEDPFVFVCRPDHPLAGQASVSSAEIGRENLLLLEDGHCLRDHALSACKLQDRQTADAFGATSLFTLAQMVRSGLGSTLLPRLAVEQGLAEGAGLVAVPVRDGEASPSRDLGLAWRHGSGREAEARALAALLA
ncbi:hydrogen peroxide-inducible genes activator [Parvularcula dongshanensis]|uniref:LysR family hydrogen peroxide-inducible transcriptional activator n=1 Tax=Parvularcula dongshanensis TaxID=1173995 RepID=A0A840I0E5_9PROT|nr:hydrogen peroxide-inducible genes activator [Parvularcula dongshanensis]MBB4658299.1 LysR family hydrogen peroxide-inducible transcriptional activator [Parvularcula dongshanensis]